MVSNEAVEETVDDEAKALWVVAGNDVREECIRYCMSLLLAKALDGQR